MVSCVTFFFVSSIKPDHWLKNSAGQATVIVKDSLLSEAITLSDLSASGQLLTFIGAVSTATDGSKDSESSCLQS